MSGDKAKAAPCDHDKVYADFTLTTYPPQRPWICRKCGVVGRDVDRPHAPSEYEAVRARFRGAALTGENQTSTGSSECPIAGGPGDPECSPDAEPPMAGSIGDPETSSE